MFLYGEMQLSQCRESAGRLYMYQECMFERKKEVHIFHLMRESKKCLLQN